MNEGPRLRGDIAAGKLLPIDDEMARPIIGRKLSASTVVSVPTKNGWGDDLNEATRIGTKHFSYGYIARQKTSSTSTSSQRFSTTNIVSWLTDLLNIWYLVTRLSFENVGCLASLSAWWFGTKMKVFSFKNCIIQCKFMDFVLIWISIQKVIM